MYKADEKRYDNMQYRRCGESGVLLPILSLGIWQNFGSNRPYENSKKMLETAFDLGITHFDMANNYGPYAGAAEETFGRAMNDGLGYYRDEMFISSKAGMDMWKGPYGNWGSKKHIIASCDQSLKRTGLEYFDVFYSHRKDGDTPLEETMGALAQLVHQGKALYIGISNYDADDSREAFSMLKQMGVHCLIHQPNYSMLNRWIEDGLTNVLKEYGVGSIPYCPLAQGLLTSKYLKEIPKDSRAMENGGLVDEANRLRPKLMALNEIAQQRGQTLAQMALAWVLRLETTTTALIGASSPEQIVENVKIIENLEFSSDELQKIDDILK